MKTKKSWGEKLRIHKNPIVKTIEKDFSDIPAGSKMLIATPIIIDSYLHKIPKGTYVDLKTIRRDLAREHKADYSCPLTTGIYLRIVAEAAYEQYKKDGNLNEVTPFWRAIKPDSKLAKKLTFGTELIREQRKKEGLVV